MNKRHYEHTLPNIRGSLSNTYFALTREEKEMRDYALKCYGDVLKGKR